MTRSIKAIQDVVDWGLCTGCGACSYACETDAVTLVNVESVGIRPRFKGDCASCARCLSVCPGHHLAATGDGHPELGPVLEIWEGYATDPEMRFRASSGGILSALSLYCLEQENMAFVLHTAMDDARPWANKTVVSRNRSDLLARCGSRYAPSSPCEGLDAIEASERPCVFIGKPCDVAAVAKAASCHPELRRNLGLTLTFFCAGTPSARGTLDLLQSLELDVSRVQAIRYRGDGWPGRFNVASNGNGHQNSLSYLQSWSRLQRYRPLRCHLCPDGLGRFADLSCGDAWQHHAENDPGRSLVLVRTQRGREILNRAMIAGYVELQSTDAAAVLAAQQNLLTRQRELFGRLLAMRLLLIPTPAFHGFFLFRSWMKIRQRRKLTTLLGTLRRALQRGWWHRRPVSTCGEYES